jgi:ABC-type lipoprotein release transport system permease subunit
MLIFLVGLLLGVLIGGALCVHHLRREIAANVGPQLRQLSLKIETLESVLNLALITRQGEQNSTTATSPGKSAAPWAE